MTVTPSVQRYGLAIAASAAALVLAWFVGEPACPLVAITAACIYGGRGPGLLSIAVCGLALGLLLLVPGSRFLDEANVCLRSIS